MSQPKTWEEAKNDCAAMGGYVWEVENDDEKDQVQNAIIPSNNS